MVSQSQKFHCFRVTHWAGAGGSAVLATVEGAAVDTWALAGGESWREWAKLTDAQVLQRPGVLEERRIGGTDFEGPGVLEEACTGGPEVEIPGVLEGKLGGPENECTGGPEYEITVVLEDACTGGPENERIGGPEFESPGVLEGGGPKLEVLDDVHVGGSKLETPGMLDEWPRDLENHGVLEEA